MDYMVDVKDLNLASLDYKSDVLTTISTVSPHCHKLSSYCVSLWTLWKELHCTPYKNWWAFSNPHALKMKTACLSLGKIRCHKVLVPFLLL